MTSAPTADTPTAAPAAPAGPPPVAPETSAEAILELVKGELATERERKKSLEAKAAGVITTAGTITTLLFALAAVITGRTGYVLPVESRWALGAAVVAYSVAVVLAILVLRPRAAEEILAEELVRISTPAIMSAPPTVNLPPISRALATVLASARKADEIRVNRLVEAVSAELVGTVLVALAVIVVLAGG
jgi:hypothetical protein